MALVTGAYVILGGLRAVIITDVVQSVLMLIGGLIVAFVVFGLPEVGGWSGMRAMDAAAAPDVQKMHLYESSSHLPFLGLECLAVSWFFTSSIGVRINSLFKEPYPLDRTGKLVSESLPPAFSSCLFHSFQLHRDRCILSI